MAIKITAERQFILDFISVYRSLPALWDSNCKEYTNRVIKNKQYDVLVEKYRERFPEADKEEVKKKINSLRSNFRKQLRRFANAGEEDVESSKCWYFEEMDFLQNLEHRTSRPRPSYDYLYTADYGCGPTATLCEGNGNEDSDEQAISAQAKVETLQTPPIKKKKIDSSEDLVEIACKRLQPDEYDTIAAAWAVELRKMEPSQQMFAKKAINDVLFEGQMGTLHRDSLVINNNGANP